MPVHTGCMRVIGVRSLRLRFVVANNRLVVGPVRAERNFVLPLWWARRLKDGASCALMSFSHEKSPALQGCDVGQAAGFFSAANAIACRS